MATISLCMIVKNEEAVLGRCLDSAAGLVDEIVVVDTGSTDATREIATRYADRVCEFAWIDDFAAARNFAFAQASMEYCMWLDADDVIEPEDQVSGPEAISPGLCGRGHDEVSHRFRQGRESYVFLLSGAHHPKYGTAHVGGSGP